MPADRPFGTALNLPPVEITRASLLTVVLTVAIFASHFVSDGHDSQRLIQLVFIAIATVLLAVGAWPAGPGPAIGWHLRLPLLLMFFLGVGSSLAAYAPRQGFTEVFLLTCLVLCAIGVAREMRQHYGQKLLFTLTCVAWCSIFYLALIFAIYAGALWADTPPDPYVFSPGFNNYRFLNHAQTISIPLLVLLSCMCPPSQRWRWLAAASCWFIPLYAVAGRGTALGLTAAMIVMCLLRRRQAGQFARNMVTAALLGLAAYWLVLEALPAVLGREPFSLLGSVVGRTVRDPTSLRDVLWTRCLLLVQANPWLGVGPMHFAHYSVDIDNAAHPHNWFVQIGTEWGIPALLCCCAAVGAAARALLRAGARVPTDDQDNQLLFSAWIFIGVAILVDGLVSGLIVMPVSQMLIVLYIGCAGGWVWSRIPPSEYVSGRSRFALGGAMLAATVGLFICIAPDVASYLSGTLYAEKPMALRSMRPRFWAAGFF